MNANPALEGALDELYGADPSEFVAVRTRHAAELSKAGEKDAAKQVRAARRPSTSAWALNRLARAHPDLVAELLDRSADLVAAQTRAVSGNPDALRDAIRVHRDALTATVDAALANLGSRANDAFRAEIVSTLRAASTDDDVGGRLRAGRIVHEESSSGFPEGVGLTLVPAAEAARREPSKRAAPKSAEQPNDAERRSASAREKHERDARAREAHAASERAARAAAQRDAERADRDAERARMRVEKLRNQLDAAQAELDAALTRSRAAKRAAGTTD